MPSWWCRYQFIQVYPTSRVAVYCKAVWMQWQWLNTGVRMDTQKTVTYCWTISTCMCFGMFNLNQFESCPSECWSRNGECSKITQHPSTARPTKWLQNHLKARPTLCQSNVALENQLCKKIIFQQTPPFWVISQPCFITRGSANPHAILRSGSSDRLVPQRIALLWRAVGVAWAQTLVTNEPTHLVLS